MAIAAPVTELDPRYSDPEAEPTPWADARLALAAAELFWLSTIRPDGRPHVTPLLAVWADEALWFCTGADERKAANLAQQPACTLTTGCNALRHGLDLVVEGRAARVRDEVRLGAVAGAYLAKYGEDWRFQVRDGDFHHDGGAASAFCVRPETAFAFAKGPYAQSRYRFAPERSRSEPLGDRATGVELEPGRPGPPSRHRG